MTLDNLKYGEKAFIKRVNGDGAFKKRIIEMGFIEGHEIKHLKDAPLKDPIEFKIMNYNVSLRKKEAKQIEIVKEKELVSESIYQSRISASTDSEFILNNNIPKDTKSIVVALVGNPNCGKTTIFNYASNSKEKVGNYSGVTVEVREAKFNYKGYEIKLIDLPGVYSLSPILPEDKYVRNYLLENRPDFVVNVIDSTNLERNLFLTMQLMELKSNLILALNMYDEIEKKNDSINHDLLSKEFQLPLIKTIGLKGKGIDTILEKIVSLTESEKAAESNGQFIYNQIIEKSIDDIVRKCNQLRVCDYIPNIPERYIALDLIEGNNTFLEKLNNEELKKEILSLSNNEVNKLETEFKESADEILSKAKYSFITETVNKVYKKAEVKKKNLSEIIDSVVTNKIIGLPIFLAFMWFMFYATFTLGEYPMGWIEESLTLASDLVKANMSEGMIRDLLTDAVINGALGVLIFLPNILILYFFISLMEDTGYMARAVFVMDKAMAKIGLNGKSFIPLLIGFGCNVPAILSSRMIENRKERIITMLINPFMSCSARLPVYVLFISAFFVSYKSLTIFAIYLIGIILAIVSSLIFKKTLFKNDDLPFIMELPPYRIPTLKAVSKHMWFRTSHYIKKVGGIIMAASIIIWALGYFPRDVEFSRNYDQEIANVKAVYSINMEEARANNNEMLDKIAIIEKQKESERQEKSYIGKIGKFVLPVLEPLGFDWKMSISIITGIAAKEIVVGTMGVLYQAEEDEENTSLIQKLQEQKYQSGERKGEKVFTPLVAFGFMVFILLYFPCSSVVAAIKRETGNWKWAIFSIVYSTSLAWVAAYMIKIIGSMFL